MKQVNLFWTLWEKIEKFSYRPIIVDFSECYNFMESDLQ